MENMDTYFQYSHLDLMKPLCMNGESLSLHKQYTVYKDLNRTFVHLQKCHFT